MKTPNYDHYPNVYEPSEDTFLVLDALEDEIKFLQALRPLFVAEIGSGSGVNISALTNVLRNTVSFATDVNPEACRATTKTARSNYVQIDCCIMNLLDCYTNSFDVVIFNPPYVVTDSAEIRGNGIERSWAGGANGREVIDEFLEKLPKMLSDVGVCYLVAIKENDPDGICDVVRAFGMTATIIKDRRVRGEHLFILKFQKVHK